MGSKKELRVRDMSGIIFWIGRARTLICGQPEVKVQDYYCKYYSQGIVIF